MLKHFKINQHRDLLAPDFECYQMDLKGPVDAAIAAGEVDEEFKLLPSWSKFGAAPIKSKGFFVRVLESVFLNKGGHDELNVDLQTFETPEQRVAMMFISAKNNENLNTIVKQAQEALPGYEVIGLNGAAFHNGQRVNNRKAEQMVKEVVSLGRPTLIISNNMAQRSFSIPELSEVYLAYDAGSEGTTIQKISRALTPGELSKIGRIFSLSFDPNRDDKFDAMIVETAINYRKKKPAMSLRDAMAAVLSTIDIFACTPEGGVKINVDTYLEKALARKGISRVLGKIVKLDSLEAEMVTALANGNGDYFRAAKEEAAKKGKTKDAAKKAKGQQKKTDASKKEIAKARETIVNIVENMDIILGGTASASISEALKSMYDYKERIESEFNVDLDIITYLFDHNIISRDWIELIHD